MRFGFARGCAVGDGDSDAGGFGCDVFQIETNEVWGVGVTCRRK